MSVVRVAFGVGWFVAAMLAGWALRRCGWLTEARVSALMRLVFVVLAPLVLCFTLWSVEFGVRRLWILPLLGATIAASTLLPAWTYARWGRLSRPQTGSFLTCAFFSNLGYMGAFTAFALYGEQAYALCVLFFLFFSPAFYTLGTGIAGRYGHRASAGVPGQFMEGIRLFPFAGMVVGFLLNLADVPRPALLGTINHVLIPVDTAIYLVAIGSQLTFEPPTRFWRPSAAMAAIKFLYAPLVAWGLVTLAGLEGLPRFVVLLEASTPVAVSPLIFPLLFGLDRRLSNALWLSTTLVAIPWLLLVIPLLQRL